MIYTTGTIAINGNTVTGAGTNFSEPLSLIRVGCTLIAISNPVQIFTITEIKSGTELSVTPAANPAIAAGTKFSILLSDSISVDGLAQDVAETLRYYQSKETEIAAAVEWWNEFGGDGQMEQLLADIRTETAQSTANAQKTESDKNAAAASKTAAANSATAAKASQDAAKASETAASNSKTAAATSETNAAKSAADALNYRNQAQAITGSNIGLSSNPRGCPDISGNPSGYIGFLRIMDTAVGWPSIASGEQYLSGFICPTLGSVPAFSGLFIGHITGSAYTYKWSESTGPQWTRHARKDEVSRLVQGSSETALWAAGGKQKFVLWDSGTGELINWGVYDDSQGKWCPLKVGHGGTGGVTPEQARTNLEVMYEKKSNLGSTNINTLTGEYSGFYFQGLNVNATSDNGYPTQSAGSLLVIKNGANGNAGCTQFYFPFNGTNGVFYMRQYIFQSSTTNWEWSAWKKSVSTERIEEGESTTYVYSKYLPDAPRIQVSTSGLWGCHNGSGWVPLSLSQGGTGALTASDARNNLNLGESNAVKFKNLTLTEALDANLGVLVKIGRDWNTQHTDNIQKFIPMSGSTNGPAGAMVLGGFHAQYSTNHAVQFGGRNSVFWGRTIENGTVQEWHKLATIDTQNIWTADNHFTGHYIFDSSHTRFIRHIAYATTSANVQVMTWGGSSSPLNYEVKAVDTNGAQTSLKTLFVAKYLSDGSASLAVEGTVTCTSVAQSSDRDLKDNIQVIGDATEAIRKMNGYTYTLKENGLPYAGVIAQEVMEALPEAVGSFTHYGKELQGPTTDGNELREETRYLNVDYAAVTGLLVQVARETDNRVTELEEENASLRANIAAMDERIAKLEALVSKLTGSEK